MRDLGFHLDAKRPQMVRDERSGAELAVPEFRVFVNVTSPCDHLRLDGSDLGLDLLCEDGLCDQRGGDAATESDGNE